MSRSVSDVRMLAKSAEKRYDMPDSKRQEVLNQLAIDARDASLSDRGRKSAIRALMASHSQKLLHCDEVEIPLTMAELLEIGKPLGITTEKSRLKQVGLL